VADDQPDLEDQQPFEDDGLSLTVTDPVYWADHPAELREALLKAADLPVTHLQTVGDSVRSLAMTPIRIAASMVSSIFNTASVPEPQHARLTFTVDEAAQVLGISRAFAYESVRRGDIPNIKIGKRILIPKVALERLLASADSDEHNQSAS